MRVNTANGVLVLLSAVGFCSAVKDKRTGQIVTDLAPVVHEVSKSVRFDNLNLKNRIPLNYELTFNEKFCLSRLPVEADNDEVEIEKALTAAQDMDRREAEKIPYNASEFFYEKVLAFHMVTNFFNEFRIIYDEGITNEVELAYEYAKITNLNRLSSETIKSILNDPAKAHEALLEKHSILVSSIANLLKSDKSAAQKKMFLGTKIINEYTIHRLMKITSEDCADEVLNILMEEGIMDRRIREAGSGLYKAAVFEIESYEALVEALLKLTTVLNHVLRLLESASEEEVLNIGHYSMWSGEKQLEVPLIKSVLLKEKEATNNAFVTMQDAEITRLKKALDEGNLVSKDTFKFLLEKDIKNIQCKIQEKGKLDEKDIRQILGMDFDDSGIKNILKVAGPDVVYSNYVHDANAESVHLLDLEKGCEKLNATRKIKPLDLAQRRKGADSNYKLTKLLEIRNKKNIADSALDPTLVSVVGASHFEKYWAVYITAAALIITGGGAYFLRHTLSNYTSNEL